MSKNSLINYTVIGQSIDKKKSDSISVIILNRGNRVFQEELYSFLQDFSIVNEIISIEKPSTHIDIEILVKNYTKLRFILTDNDNTGAKVNISMKEVRNDFVLVIWSDMLIENPFWIPTIIKELKEKNALCFTPYLYDNTHKVIPSILSPALDKKREICYFYFLAEQDYQNNLSIFDYTGFYQKQKFFYLDGFDINIENPFLQKLDFGYRAYMWGEEIYYSKKLRIQYRNNYPVEYMSGKNNKDYYVFFLKNYLPLFQKDHITIPLFRNLALLRKENIKLRVIFPLYLEIKEWLLSYQYRFKKDIKGVVELWFSDKFSL